MLLSQFSQMEIPYRILPECLSFRSDAFLEMSYRAIYMHVQSHRLSFFAPGKGTVSKRLLLHSRNCSHEK